MEDSKITEAKQLAGLVAYQKDAIVSREIIGKETGTITIFAFDRGQGLSEHTAPFDAFVYVPEGRAEITIAGTPASPGAGRYDRHAGPCSPRSKSRRTVQDAPRHDPLLALESGPHEARLTITKKFLTL